MKKRRNNKKIISTLNPKQKLRIIEIHKNLIEAMCNAVVEVEPYKKKDTEEEERV